MSTPTFYFCGALHTVIGMLRQFAIVCALAMYVSIVGCALITSADATQAAAPVPQAPASVPLVVAEGLPYRSVTLQLQRVDWIDRYKASIDEIAALGANAVKFVVDARQENAGSSQIYLDLRMTPTPDQLGDLIRYAKRKKLHVILMPIVLLDVQRKPTEWRGTIAPENPEKWWESYRSMMTHFAWIAQANGVDVLMVGSELVSMNNKVDEWTETIKKVREVFKGALTYSSNWDNYKAVKIWDQLDMIAMNSYWTFGTREKPQPTVEEIKAEWARIQKELLEFQKTQGKPILFSEVGWCSMANMAYQPWDYTISEREAPLDLDLQRRLYEGFFQTWHGQKELAGFSIWEWNPDGGGPKDRGYTPKGKPAEQVLREWLAKPW